MKALIIIDMFVRDVKKRKDKNKLISNQLQLIKAFKNSKQKVILVGGDKSGKFKLNHNPVMVKLWGQEASKNPEENKIVPELLASEYDYYIVKSEYSAFYKTRLEKIIRKERITELYFAGLYAGVCVYFSAADAAMRGIQPYLISDASSSSDKKTHKNQRRFKTALGPVILTSELLRKLKA